MDKMLDIKLVSVWIFTIIATTFSLSDIEIIIRIVAYTFVASFTAYNWYLKIKEKRRSKK